jgi:glycerol-3-phosphate O-acyltransferase / dihydroxyacetone phosphate acyltransferase
MGESRSYRAVVWLLRIVVRIYFRRVEVSGAEHLPASGGGLVVSWHPNGLIDPGLIITHLPRRVAFGARHGLFRTPLLGALMRAVGAVPIHRAVDLGASAAERRAANQHSLAALAEQIAAGAFAALFPEGVSHDAPHLRELKTGAARLYYQARQLAPGQPPAILPVGLHYDEKHLFRSSALVAFHPPIELPPELDVTPLGGEPDEAARDRCRRLTSLLESTLTEVVHATEDWQLHHLMHRARKLVRAERAERAGAEPGKPKMHEKTLGFARIWAGYYARLQTNPAQVAELRARIERYDADLRALALEDHELDGDPRLVSPWLFALLALQVLTVYLVLPPVLVIGWVVNLPVALALIGLSSLVSKEKKDEASVKLLVGALLFPAAWIGIGVLAGLAHLRLHAAIPSIPETPILAGILVGLLSALGGATALRYLRVARETARAVRVRLSRRRRASTIEKLRRERAVLHDRIIELATGLELPGAVGPDGRIVDAAIP